MTDRYILLLLLVALSLVFPILELLYSVLRHVVSKKQVLWRKIVIDFISCICLALVAFVLSEYIKNKWVFIAVGFLTFCVCQYLLQKIWRDKNDGGDN